MTAKWCTVLAVALAVAVAGCAEGSGTPDRGGRTATVDVEAAPQQVTWRPYQGVAVPFSVWDGPSVDIATDTPTGYGRTPQGAVLAAMQGQVRVALAPDRVWPAVANTLVTAGPGRDGFATARALISITSAADPDHTARYVGYRILAYTADRADLELATEMPSGALSAATVSVAWRNEDWKLQLREPIPQAAATQGPATPDGSAIPGTRVLASLDGFVVFGS